MNHTSVMPVAQGSVNYKLNFHAGALDWSKGAAKSKSNRTHNNVAAVKSEAKPEAAEIKCGSGVCASQFLNAAELAEKVLLLVNLTHACKIRVPEMLAREAAVLGKFDFNRLMNALEERADIWSDDERFYVFKHSNGQVGSVWLGGIEVYRSLGPVV